MTAESQDSPQARFGAELRGLRERKGLSQHALGPALGLARNTISDFENGRRLPGREIVVLYETFFELKPGTLGALRESARLKPGTLPARPERARSQPPLPSSDVQTDDGVRDPDDPITRHDTPPARLGAELHRLREETGLTLRALAGKLELGTHTVIVDFERGRKLPPVDVVERYERFFATACGELLAMRERARVYLLDNPLDGRVVLVDNPYQGLPAFERQHAGLFFGRERKVEEVLERLRETRFVAVIGASGSGKSSFVRAGLLAAITEPADGATAPQYALLTPGEHPVAQLASTVSTAMGAADAGLLVGDLRADPVALARATSETGPAGLVIVVDQLEELFTMCRDEAERRCFVDALLAAWRDHASRVTLIFALRADFYGHVTDYPYPELADAFTAHETLGPMTDMELRSAIEGPADRRDLQLASGLVDTILSDLGDEPGALPLLSHALYETCERHEGFRLTAAGYHAAGGVSGAIAKTAEGTFKGLDDGEQKIARSIFLRLTDIDEGAQPTRRRIDRVDLPGDPESLQRVLGTLADARLVTLGEGTIDVAHEALIRHWKQLRDWIDEDRVGLLTQRRLSEAAREWNIVDREPAALYGGARLAAAQDWATGHPDDLSRLESDFLAASKARARSELVAAKRRVRRLRVLAIGLGALTVIVVVVALWALEQRSVVADERDTAQAERMATDALGELTSNPTRALALGLQAYTKKATSLTESALRVTASQATPQLVLHGDERPVSVLEFAPDGRHLASADNENGTVQVWNLRRPRTPSIVLPGNGGGVSALVFSDDGSRLAIGTRGGSVRVWSWSASRKAARVLRGGGDKAVSALTFASGADVVIGADEGGKVRVWNSDTGRRAGRPLSLFPGLALADQFRFSAFVHGDKVRLLSGGRGMDLRGGIGAELGAPTLAFSLDGHHLAGGAFNSGAVRVWDTRAPRRPPVILNEPQGSVDSIAFAGDRRHLASAGSDGTVRVWDWRARRVSAVLRGEDVFLTGGVAFSGDGRYVASGQIDGTVRVWDWRAALPATAILQGRDVPGLENTVVAAGGDTLIGSDLFNGVRVWGLRALHAAPNVLSNSLEDVQVAVTPDGRRAAAVDYHGVVRVWDLSRRRRRPVVLRVTDAEQVGLDLDGAVAFAGNAPRLASRDEKGVVRIWDLSAPRSPPTILRGRGELTNSGLASSRDGRFLASVGQNGTVAVWDWHALRHAPTVLPTGQVAVKGVALSRDGRYLASAGADGTVRIWDWQASPARPVILRGHDDTVKAVTFADDDRHLASASDDGTVRIWDWRALRTTPTVLRGHRRTVSSVAFTGDGRHLVSAGNDQTVRVWDCDRCGPIKDVLRLARARLPRDIRP